MESGCETLRESNIDELSTMKICCWLLVMRTFAFAVVASNAAVETRAGDTVARSEHFDKDPVWEGWQNRISPRNLKTVEQEFGFSAMNFAGKEKGEIGGTIWRDSKAAWYADKIPVK